MTRLSLAHLWPTSAEHRDQPLRFTLTELSGSLGDMGTFLPLAVAMAWTCGMDIGLIFIVAGLLNIATGVWFRQPIPVQPMKAVAAIAIAEGLSPGTVAAAGMVTGMAVLALAIVGGVDWIARSIPMAVVRGIQVGIGLKLAWKGLLWLGDLSAVGWDSWTVAIATAAFILCLAGRRQPILLYVFLAGFVLLGLDQPEAYRQLAFHVPSLKLANPSLDEWWKGLTQLAAPQLPLTLLNSVVAVCVLSSDYFPGRGIRPRRMAVSVGLMNLLTVPLGGMPMCHGAGGLAAQYHFGARTGGSVIMLGGLKVVAGLLLSGVLLNTLPLYPRSILAVMVIAAGLALTAAARDSLRGRSMVVVAAMAIVTACVTTAGGLVVGCLLIATFAWRDRRHLPEPNRGRAIRFHLPGRQSFR